MYIMFGDEADHSQNEGKKFLNVRRWSIVPTNTYSCTTSFYIVKVNGRAVTRGLTATGQPEVFEPFSTRKDVT